MEKTQNFNTSKNLMEYYKTNIDVHLDYLQALNTTMPISKSGYMELSQELELVRKLMYEELTTFEQLPTDAESINEKIITELCRILEIKNISEIKEYIAYNLDKETIFDLVIAKTLNKIFRKTSSIKVEDELDQTIANILNDLKRTLLSLSLKIEGVENYTIAYFLERLSIHYDEENSVTKYIYDYIARIKMITNLLKHKNCNIDNDFANNIYNSFEETLHVHDINELDQAIDTILLSIANLNEKHFAKHL